MVRKNPPLYSQSYLDTGKGPVVILLHGLFGNLGMWKHVIAALKNDYRVIVPRLPLFELPIENASVKFLVKVLNEFIEWNQLDDVTLIGHALGGQLSLTYTHQYPNCVSKLVLSSSAGLIDKHPFINPHDVVNNYEYVHDKVGEAFYRKEFVSNKLVDEIYSTVQNIPKRLALGNIIRSSRHSGVASFLNKIDHPVLLVWGLNDKVNVPEQALHFHDLLPNSEVKFIDQCGHLPMVENAALFNKYLLQFLNEPNPLKNWYG
ncbi:MAG: alpha/beta hydrolase [Cyclobacteriaceae bacterium]|nr:alpha/beta hydrolase [Cyclobacteriaceae bacterium]